jgi:uncharacterized membrane protein YbaN (DUF454 family)
LRGRRKVTSKEVFAAPVYNEHDPLIARVCGTGGETKSERNSCEFPDARASQKAGVTRMLRNSAWLLIGLSATAAGIAGIILPLVPTTPFLLLAAYCFARSSPLLHNWLVTHPTLGRPIDDWQRHRAISRRTKVVSIAVMVLAYVASVAVGFPPWVLAVQAVFLVGAAAFILSRADRPEDTT